MDKDFFEWLFKALKIDVNGRSMYSNIYKNGFKNVDRYTRAGKNGKVIICPVCGEPELVYHFSWSAMTCPSCRESSDKNDWLVGI
jgi:rubrerythrin